MLFRFLSLLSVAAFSVTSAVAVPTVIIDELTGGGGNVVEAVITDGDATGPYVDLSGVTNRVLVDTQITTWDISVTANSTGSTPAGPNSNLLSFVARNTGLIERTLVIGLVEDYGAAQFTPGFPQLKFRVNASDIDETGGPVRVDFFGQVGTNATAPTDGSAAGLPFSTYGLTTGPGTVFSAIDLQEGADALGFYSPVSSYSTALFAVVTAAAGTEVSFDFSVEAVPEPGFYGLLSLALSGLFFFGYRKRNAAGELNS